MHGRRARRTFVRRRTRSDGLAFEVDVPPPLLPSRSVAVAEDAEAFHAAQLQTHTMILDRLLAMQARSQRMTACMCKMAVYWNARLDHNRSAVFDSSSNEKGGACGRAEDIDLFVAETPASGRKRGTPSSSPPPSPSSSFSFPALFPTPPPTAHFSKYLEDEQERHSEAQERQVPVRKRKDIAVENRTSKRQDTKAQPTTQHRSTSSSGGSVNRLRSRRTQFPVTGDARRRDGVGASRLVNGACVPGAGDAVYRALV